MPSKKNLQKLYEFGKNHKVIFIKIEPYVEKVSNNEAMKQLNNLTISPHPLFPKWTQILDLTKSEDELLKSFHSKTRYNIRLAQKKGVTVREESNNNGFEEFSKLYFETTKRQKYFGHNYQYHKTVWNNLKNKISHILIAYYNNIPLAAYQLWYLDGVIYYVYGGTSELHRNLMASNLLMWEAIKLGKKLGATKFDMWGSLEPNYDPNDPWSGFTRFKEGYATKFTEFIGSYDLVINPLIYKIYNFIYSLREVYLKLKS
jgi:lipid II:glycine glycyltransferase (peptidoglycan interpeptide bridge formation enzyme)